MTKVDLNEFNDDENYMQNIVFYCLKSRNISALKYFIVDLKCKVPDNIYINGSILWNYEGHITLKKVLRNEAFVFNHSEYREKTRKEILNFIN